MLCCIRYLSANAALGSTQEHSTPHSAQRTQTVEYEPSLYSRHKVLKCVKKYCTYYIRLTSAIRTRRHLRQLLRLALVGLPLLRAVVLRVPRHSTRLERRQLPHSLRCLQPPVTTTPACTRSPVIPWPLVARCLSPTGARACGSPALAGTSGFLRRGCGLCGCQEALRLSTLATPTRLKRGLRL